MNGLIDPSDYDPAFPGGNYEDWIMLIQDVDQYTPKIVGHIIEIQREMRKIVESGGKLKKGGTSTEMVKELKSIIPRAPEPPMKRRKVIND